MHDPLAMGVVDGGGHLAEHVEHFGGGEFSLLLDLLQRAPLQEPHHDIGWVVGSVEIVDREQVRVLQLGDEPRFALEPLPQGAVLEKAGVDHLDRDVPVHAGLVGAVDGGHAARSDGFGDLVGAKTGADHGVRCSNAVTGS